MQCLTLPFFSEIEQSQSILLAGAGGGFDIFSGLPLYFGLRNLGKQVHLANLSFSPLFSSAGRWLSPALMEVTADTPGPGRYFPEKYLAQWFITQGEQVPIYCFDRTGVQPLLVAYQTLIDLLHIDTIILIDGGTDSLMRGDEPGLGTPEEDIASLAAVHQIKLDTKLLLCLGFGIDTFHGICHAHFLEAVSDLNRHNGFLGTWSLTKEMPEVQRYREATEAVLHAMPSHPSIVSTSILSAVAGLFGDVQANQRTVNSKLFINALMTLYWCFRVDPVAQRLLYLNDILHTQTSRDITSAIEHFRARLPRRKEWVDLPM
ncbi:hypothetical protein KDW_38710 [Dictyobacter vulcani]|uniref:DUF1152 domain-containing protein n=1 Tax=Dictyobacter vulcani TaxID=2607529 RepID=A0A5J4KUG6_9CHLR|nr:DUF1152 domain-containing protein [Dictyobacter vulcani]GER89709.1 hypothetical protein KDW_38710 [Dictyobacter vulcani]